MGGDWRVWAKRVRMEGVLESLRRPRSSVRVGTLDRIRIGYWKRPVDTENEMQAVFVKVKAAVQRQGS